MWIENQSVNSAFALARQGTGQCPTHFSQATGETRLFRRTLTFPCTVLEKRETFVKTPSDRDYLTVEELKRMSEVETGSPVTKQTFMFCCFTGLRHSDLLQLYWRDIRETEDGL